MRMRSYDVEEICAREIKFTADVRSYVRLVYHYHFTLLDQVQTTLNIRNLAVSENFCQSPLGDQDSFWGERAEHYSHAG